LNREFAWEAHHGPFRRITPAQAAAYDEAGFFVLEDAFDPAMVRTASRRRCAASPAVARSSPTPTPSPSASTW